MTAPRHDSGLSALGAYLREQRELAQLSIREMARLSKVSNAYLSQVERGLHAPSVRVLQAIADTLSIPTEELVGRGRRMRGEHRDETVQGVEYAIRADTRLSSSQKKALLSVYRSYVAEAKSEREAGNP
ncbi:MAG: helix-turn-helix transcriptional regulator [Candidatus Nanopelagicales bacterium]